MSTKVYTKEDGVIFKQLLLDLAEQAPTDLFLSILINITDHIEINTETGSSNLFFKNEYKEIQG